MENDEHLLIRKAQRGNIQAFEQLVQQYDSKVMQLIYNMVNDSEDTRDLYQEVFIKVFKAIKKFRFQSEFYTWLYRITINTCINFRQRKKTSHFVSFNFVGVILCVSPLLLPIILSFSSFLFSDGA